MPVAQVLLWLKDSSNGELVMPLRRILRKRPPASPALTTVEPPAAVLTAPAPIRELHTRGQLITVTRPNDSTRSEEHTSELQSRGHLVCRLLLEKKKTNGDMKGTNERTAYTILIR